jgi:hypothetical protein
MHSIIITFSASKDFTITHFIFLGMKRGIKREKPYISLLRNPAWHAEMGILSPYTENVSYVHPAGKKIYMKSPCFEIDSMKTNGLHGIEILEPTLHYYTRCARVVKAVCKFKAF